MKTDLIPSEDQEQETLIQWCDAMRKTYPGVDLIYAIPNGGLRNKTTAAKLKATGVRPGVPDLFLPVARGKYHGLYIEMKRRKGGKVSVAQKAYIDKLEQQGYACQVCLGYEDAINVIRWYYKQ